MDHCQKDAAKLFFDSVAAPILKKVGNGRICAFFCDSLELTGNNFSSLVLEEFEKRRGYDFTKALPAM